MTGIRTFVKLTLKAARAICGTIGFPSKMPGTSYGIPAQACITGAKLAQIEGSVCFDCYAMRGNYLYPSVQKAQQTRLIGINHNHWVDAVVTLLENDHAPERIYRRSTVGMIRAIYNQSNIWTNFARSHD